MTVENYNIPDLVHKNFAYYIIRKEGNFVQSLNVDKGFHSDDLLFEMDDGRLVVIIKKREKAEVDLMHKRYDLKIIAIPSEINLFVNKLDCEGIKLEKILETDKK